MSFGANLMRGMYFDVELTRLRKKQRPASDRKEGQCCRSGHCCWRRPCDLGPEDPTRISAHLGISERKLFEEFLIVDTGGEGGFTLRPRRAGQSGGRMISSAETYDLDTPCVFLDEKNDNACKIHDVKPVGGKSFKCWEPDSGVEPTWDKVDLVKLGWDGSNPDDYDAGDYDCSEDD